MAVVKKPTLLRNLLFLAGALLLIYAGYSYFRTKGKEEKTDVAPEEIIVQEEGVVRKTEEGEEVLSEEEIQAIREEVDGVVSLGGRGAVLVDVGAVGASGEAKTAFSDGKFYARLTISGLRMPEKGYYYEGWLKNDDFLSLGRMELNQFGEGVLYYTASIDRSDYSWVVVTLEPEDGDPAPAKAVLEGSF